MGWLPEFVRTRGVEESPLALCFDQVNSGNRMPHVRKRHVWREAWLKTNVSSRRGRVVGGWLQEGEVKMNSLLKNIHRSRGLERS
jgi:hypothetical protein